jgi:CheY-like chemotaxis protein
MPVSMTAREFQNELRKSLRLLYEPIELRRSRLIEIFRLDAAIDQSASLRKVLQESIQALKPDPSTPADTGSSRIYEVLYYRYVEQSSLKEVAMELALSIRQVHRIETAGLEALSVYLISRYQLSFASDENGDDQPAQASSEISELEWLRKSFKSEDIDLYSMIDSAIATIQPLIENSQVEIRIAHQANSAWMQGDVTILRQALVNTLITVFQLSPVGIIHAKVSTSLDQVHFIVNRELSGQPEQLEYNDQIREMTDLVAQLVKILGGSIEIEIQPGKRFQIDLIFPIRDRLIVMVIDDNRDALLLVERYLTGTVYQFLGAHNPQQVIPLVQEFHPQILILDVMLPGIDGWKLLRDMKNAGLLASTQVIVSTILPQESLALAFGAAGFLRKPVTREKLLSLLNQLVSQAKKEQS